GAARSARPWAPADRRETWPPGRVAEETARAGSRPARRRRGRRRAQATRDESSAEHQERARQRRQCDDEEDRDDQRPEEQELQRPRIVAQVDDEERDQGEFRRG